MTSAAPLLTIAIPTYARNDILKKHLELLLPQLTPQTRLVVLDNCSPTPVSQTLADIPPRFPKVALTVQRNKANIGANANIIRCFEACETEWLWLLGDDDPVQSGAVQRVLDHISHHPHAVFINFSSALGPRSETRVTHGLDEFLDHMHYSNTLLLSVGAFRLPAVLPGLRIAYHYAYSMAAHLALVLAALGDDGEACLSHEHVVEWQQRAAMAGPKSTLAWVP